jgi:hypothetical protein
MKLRTYALLPLATLLLAGCGDQPAETPPPPASETVTAEPAEPETPAVLGEPPVAREPQIPPPSAQIALNPGTYTSDDVTLSLSALRFELEAPEQGVSAEGTYELINSILTLAVTQGETGEASFPLECLLSRAGPRILFEDFEDGSCGFLDGVSFQRETRPQ